MADDVGGQVPDFAPELVIDQHLAAGDGWVLSRGRLSPLDDQVLLLSEDTADLAGLRRRLAVAGSVAGRHLPVVRDVVATRDARPVVVMTPPGGPCLAHLAASPASLAAGEIVTLVAPLATTIATLHARGLEPAEVAATTVWLSADGCPALLPAGLRDRPGAASSTQVAALAQLGLDLLDPSSAGARELASVLRAAVAGGIDAGRLGSAVLRCTRALPIERRGLDRRRESPSRSRRPRLRPIALVAGVVAVAIGLGSLWGRHDSGAVLAAPAVAAPDVHAATSPSVGAPRWIFVMTELEQTRARAYAAGDLAALDRVYAPGSPTGRADRGLLGRMVRRGERAAGLQAFVESVDVITATDTIATLRVTDALTAYDVVTVDGHVASRGHGRPSSAWIVSLRKTTAGWRISSISRARIQAPVSSCSTRERC